MAGVPPLAGFFAKFYLLSALVERGLFIPAIVILSTGFISAYYYLRIIKTFWFEEDNISPRKIKVLLSEGQRMQLSILEVILWMTVLLVTSILPSLDAVVFTLTICGDASCVASSCRYFSELPAVIPLQ